MAINLRMNAPVGFHWFQRGQWLKKFTRPGKRPKDTAFRTTGSKTHSSPPPPTAKTHETGTPIKALARSRDWKKRLSVRSPPCTSDTTPAESNPSSHTDDPTTTSGIPPAETPEP